MMCIIWKRNVKVECGGGKWKNCLQRNSKGISLCTHPPTLCIFMQLKFYELFWCLTFAAKVKSLPPLTGPQTTKLKHLTIVTLAAKCRVRPFRCHMGAHW